MADQPLPTKSSFLKSLETIPTCDICHEAFDEFHVPTRTKCHHTFGSTCLRKWIDSSADQSNACPMCREVLFKKTPQPSFVAGSRPRRIQTIWLEDIHTRRRTDLFVKILWERTFELYAEPSLYRDVIYDSDLEAWVNEALLDFSRVLERTFVFCVRQENWPKLMAVAKAMVKEHFEHGREERDHVEDMDATWTPKVHAALGWVEEDFKDLDSEIDEDEAYGEEDEEYDEDYE